MLGRGQILELQDKLILERGTAKDLKYRINILRCK